MLPLAMCPIGVQMVGTYVNNFVANPKRRKFYQKAAIVSRVIVKYHIDVTLP